MRARLSLGFSVAALLAFGSGLAHADPSPTSRLTYLRAAGAESCPDTAALRAGVASRVGYDPFFPWARREIVVEIERRDKRFVARVRTLEDESGAVRGERQVSSETATCTAVFEAVALDVSMAIDSWRLDPVSDTNDAPSAPAASASPPLPSQPPAVVAAAAEASLPDTRPRAPAAPFQRPAFLVGAGGRSTLGVAPSLAVGAEVFAEARLGIESLELAVYAQPPAGASMSPAGAWVAVSLVAGEVAPCLHAGWAAFCAVAAVGWLEGSPSGFRGAHPASSYFLGSGARFGVDWSPTPRWVFRVSADALANAHRAELVIDQQTAWTAPVIMASLGVTTAYRF